MKSSPAVINWIGLRPEKRAKVIPVKSAQLTLENGLLGDHYSGKSGTRQLTLIRSEDLEIIASELNLKTVPPEWTRRNLLVSNLHLPPGNCAEYQLKIGSDIVVQLTGPCRPCELMEKNLGPGGLKAMKDRGGFTAKVLKGGSIHVNDSIWVV